MLEVRVRLRFRRIWAVWRAEVAAASCVLSASGEALKMWKAKAAATRVAATRMPMPMRRRALGSAKAAAEGRANLGRILVGIQHAPTGEGCTGESACATLQ